MNVAEDVNRLDDSPQGGWALATRSGGEALAGRWRTTWALATRLRRLAVTRTSGPIDQYSVLATRAISCPEREGLYVLDGLLEKDTIFHRLEHSTGTHGFTEQLLGLCYLLGYSFMPRLRDLADQQLYRVVRKSLRRVSVHSSGAALISLTW